MDFSHIDPLSVDFKGMTYIEMADWLTYLRNLIKREAFDTDEQYYEELELLVQDWQSHYDTHQSAYKSVKFRKALLVCQLKDRITFEIDYGLGKEPFSIDTYQSVLQGSIFKEKASVEADFRAVSDTIFDDVEKIFKTDNIGNYKNLLYEVVATQRFMLFTTTYRILHDGKKVSASSYKELMQSMGTQKFKVVRKQRTKKRSYNLALAEFDIPKTIYNDFTNSFRCEKDFNKKFFINLAFALALPFEWAERLLQYNGYTLKSNGRVFDEVMSTAFRLGLSREMAIALIDKKNQDLKRQSGGKFNPVPNITNNRK